MVSGNSPSLLLIKKKTRKSSFYRKKYLNYIGCLNVCKILLSSPIFGKCCGEKVGEEKGNGKA